MKVRCLRRYSDLKLGRDVLEGEELEMAKERAEELAGTENKAGIALVEIIGTENETDQAENETVSESDTKKKRTSKKKAADE